MHQTVRFVDSGKLFHLIGWIRLCVLTSNAPQALYHIPVTQIS